MAGGTEKCYQFRIGGIVGQVREIDAGVLFLAALADSSEGGDHFGA